MYSSESSGSAWESEFPMNDIHPNNAITTTLKTSTLKTSTLKTTNRLTCQCKSLKKQLRSLKRRSRILLSIAAQELAHLEANNVLSNLKAGVKIRVCFRVVFGSGKTPKKLSRLQWYVGTVQRVHKRRVHVGADPSDSHVLVDVDFEDGDKRKCFPLQLDLQGDSHDADARWVIIQ